jgi:menaquinone-dependent protoporphyrinogen oxidase
MENKILITYASKYGATEEIARKIGIVLREAGLSVEVLPVKEAGDLSGYTAIVLGSALYMGRWRGEAVRFLKGNTQTLAQMPLWLFSSGPTGEGDPVKLVEGYIIPLPIQALVNQLHPRDVTVFHGSTNIAKLNFFEKWVLNKVKAEIGDFRDWDAISAWAEAISMKLKENAGSPALDF